MAGLLHFGHRDCIVTIELHWKEKLIILISLFQGDDYLVYCSCVEIIVVALALANGRRVKNRQYFIVELQEQRRKEVLKGKS